MKSVKIAEFKARLSHYLREVRRGELLTVTDREHPIVRVVPYGIGSEPVQVREPLGRYNSLRDVPIPPAPKMAVDPVDLLLADRRAGRDR